MLRLLADGAPRSGDSLERALGVSRTALSATLERLRGLGVLDGSEAGYRLSEPVELLDTVKIRGALGASTVLNLRHLEAIFEVDSTNSRLLELPPPPKGRADVCIAELQSAGRGRRGRRWIAPFGHSIAFSLAWAFGALAPPNPALSLAVGVAIGRALERLGARGIRLKWPNDVWFDGRKVGGVLLELKSDAAGPLQVIIGIGLNLSLPPRARREIEQTGVRAAAIADACGRTPSRNETVGVLLDELLSMLVQFEREGFAPFHAAWTAKDALRDRAAAVEMGGGEALRGTARGVDAQGALMLESEGTMRRFVSGEVSLRGAPG